MRLLPLLLSLAQLVHLSLATPGLSNASHPPLFSPPASSSSSLPLLHTSLSSLLPILPHLSSPPEHTLLVTLATPAFKRLLYNWLCFLRYRAKWGQPATHNEHGEPVPPVAEGDKTGWEDVVKLLVITSDERLARELSSEGVVVWWLKEVDWDAVEQADESGDEDEIARLDRELQDDLFTNLRLLDLLLPPTPPSAEAQEGGAGAGGGAGGGQMLPWGTLHYQSLMLARTLAMSALVSALVESQRSDPRWRRQQDEELRARMLEHDWESGEEFEMPKFEGVKGVLLVDNDAVWLSSPTPFLSHHYRPTSSFPSILYAADMAPTTRNAWGSYTMPCACFFYSRVSDHGAQLASTSPAPSSAGGQGEEEDPYLYSPAEGAAEVWRATAMCHIAMVLDALETGRRQAAAARLRPAPASSAGGLTPPTAPAGEGEDEEGRIASLTKARAPSFQATALGPALFLAEQLEAHLPTVSHGRWLAALGSGEVDDLLDLLEESGLTLSGLDGGGGGAGAGKRTTCLSLAQSYQTICPAPPPFLSSLTYLSSLLPFPTPSTPPPTRPHRPIRASPLPYDLFPPGMRFFDGGLEPGARPCVVHANYAMGRRKEDLLRARGLWALVEPEGEGEDADGYRCKASVMDRA
ncbi:hypothetical protein JCM10213_003114 [Rhodosporidiobolus nylandii]